MPKKKTAYDIAVGGRLRLARRALGKSAVEIADGINVSIARYSNWERGENGADPEVLARVKKEFGISLDWLYADDILSLGPDLADKVRKLRIAEIPKVDQSKRTRKTA